MRKSVFVAAKAILEAASKKQTSISTAESCTGGMLSSALTEIPGSSAIFECGFITYSNHSKMRLLGVRKKTLEAFGAVSEEVAAEMAFGALHNSKADFAVSITGVAGPGGTIAKPEGMVCFSIAFNKRTKLSKTKNFGPLGRSMIREKATLYGLELLKNALTQRP